MSLTPAGDIISDVLEKYGINDANRATLEIWEKEFYDLGRYVKLIGIKGTVLILEIDSSIINNEIWIGEDKILERINKHYGYKKFKEIQCTIRK